MKKEVFFGLEITNTTYKELCGQIIKDIDNKAKVSIVAINPEKIMKARKDDHLIKILNKFTYKIPDGIGVVIASRLRRKGLKSRITGIDTMMMLCELSNEKKYKVFMYGAKPEILKKARKNLKQKFPKINIVGAIDGYQKDSSLVLKKINEEKPNILFVALGSPKQELWIYEHLSKLNVNVIQGVGGSFDVISGNVKRAPEKMQKVGLEWLYRLFKEPKRIFRQFNLIKFIFLVIFRKEDEKYEN